MLGEMRDVIDNLAVSVNGLKDAVSDIRAGQSMDSSSTPVRDSGRGRGLRGRRGGGRGGVGEGNRSQSTGGRVNNDYAADDEGQEDEDHRQPKNYKLRVSDIIHVPRLTTL